MKNSGKTKIRIYATGLGYSYYDSSASDNQSIRGNKFLWIGGYSSISNKYITQ